MERYKNTPVLFLLLALLCDCAAGNKPCSSNNVPDLTCYTDYNSTITCVWNSPDVSDQSENVCTIQSSGRNKFHNSFCNLELVDVSRPMPKKCTMNYRRGGNFQTFDKLSINLSCSHWKQSLIMIFKPSCHIKLKPPRQPAINFTTVSWTSRLTNETNESIESYSSQLQWKHEDESWSDRSVKIKDTQCEYHCTAELDPDHLVQEEKYQARTRVKAISEGTESMWSDWSPSTPWVSLIGRTRPAPPPSNKDPTGGVFGIVVAATVFAVFLVVLRFKTDKTTWVYIAKRIKGPPLPNPANSFLNDANFQNWLSPYFTSESFQSFFKPVDIVSVEVTSTVDAVAPYGPESALLEKIRSEGSHELIGSNFSNPSYSKLCPSPPSPPSPPPVSSLTAGNLAPCATDTPYGPIGSQGQGNNAEQDREARGKEVEIRQLLSKGSNDIEPLPLISDYEKAEKLQVERVRLQSLDSGVCSSEEVSQESFEADSINVTEDGLEGDEQMEGGNGKGVDFQKLFGGSVNILSKGSIQVCSGYERVQKLPADSPEIWSLDPDVGNGGQEQMSQEESLEDVDKSTESTSLLFPPPPPSVLSCSLPSFTPLPLNFSGSGLSPALQPMPSHLLERIARMSANRSVEPSGDGYMPVRQEQS